MSKLTLRATRVRALMATFKTETLRTASTKLPPSVIEFLRDRYGCLSHFLRTLILRHLNSSKQVSRGRPGRPKSRLGRFLVAKFERAINKVHEAEADDNRIDTAEAREIARPTADALAEVMRGAR